MSTDAWIMLGLLLVMFALLIWDHFPTWVVFMGTLLVAMTIGLADEQDLLKGFSNSGVITVAALFPVAAGMYSTGAITLLANKAIGIPRSLREAQLKLFPPIALGSAFLNNTPLVAMAIPVIKDITRATDLAGSKLYMPMSFASMLGGASTLIGTSVNLIIAGLVLDKFGDDLNILFPALAGFPAAIIGIIFLMTIGNLLLPNRASGEDPGLIKRRYRADFRVEPQSRLDGVVAGEQGLFETPNYRLIRVRRTDNTVVDPTADTTIHGGDVLTYEVDADAVPALWGVIGLDPRRHGALPPDSPRHQHRLVEVVIAPDARQVGRRISDLPMKNEPYEAALIAVARGNRPPEGSIDDVVIQAGDAAIIEVADSFFYDVHREQDFLLTKRLQGFRIQRTDRALTAATVTVAMVALAAFGVMSMLNAALLATAAMLLTGCLTINRALQSIEWTTIVVLGAAVGLEAAVTGSGLSAVIASTLGALGGSSPYLALLVVFLGCIIMTNVITNAAAAAFMFPVATAMAAGLGVSHRPFIVILMLGCSYAFINPAGYQTNLMVQEPGKYTFIDYVKLGVPLTIVVGLIAMLIVPLLYPF
ncbi:MAG: SLC13 family permease [Caldilineaceae bacterium]|nr:SLC13 family permease [Caldilineaceae bacterium]